MLSAKALGTDGSLADVRVSKGGGAGRSSKRDADLLSGDCKDDSGSVEPSDCFELAADCGRMSPARTLVSIRGGRFCAMLLGRLIVGGMESFARCSRRRPRAGLTFRERTVGVPVGLRRGSSMT